MVNVQVVALRELRVVVGADPVAVAHGAAGVGLHVGAVADEDDIAKGTISISFLSFVLSFYEGRRASEDSPRVALIVDNVPRLELRAAVVAVVDLVSDSEAGELRASSRSVGNARLSQWSGSAFSFTFLLALLRVAICVARVGEAYREGGGDGAGSESEDSRNLHFDWVLDTENKREPEKDAVRAG